MIIDIAEKLLHVGVKQQSLILTLIRYNKTIRAYSVWSIVYMEQRNK
jgi:hypothetical protein